MKGKESELAQSYLTLCDSMDCSLPRSSVHGIFQARVLEWIAISFSRRSSRPRDRTQVSHFVDRLFTIWTTSEVPMSQLFASGDQSIGPSASASVLPMSIQDWFPLRLTGLISLLSKGLSRVFPRATAWKHQFFHTMPSLWSNTHIRTWLLERHSLDYVNFYHQSDVFAY